LKINIYNLLGAKIVMYYIYKLTDCNGLTYYGSSENPDERFKGHKSPNSHSSSRKMDMESLRMCVIETLPEDSTENDAKWRERWYFDNNECVNENRPIVSDEERIQQQKDYRTNNAETANVRTKEYYKKNIDLIKEKYHIYYEKNADIIKLKSKEYYEKNADIIKEKRKEYCEKNVDIIKEKSKEYYEKNVDIIKEKKKEYREKNVDIIKEKSKEYYEKNTDMFKVKNKEYYNKPEVKARKKELYNQKKERNLMSQEDKY